MGRLAQPGVVVTGAGSGLGRAFCLELARRRASVVVSDVNGDAGEATAEQVRGLGGSAITVCCDVREAEQVESLAQQAERWLSRIDLVVNNAGVAVTGLVGEVPLGDWRWVIDVNLWGVIHGCHAFVPRLKAQGSGHIINVASAAGLLNPPEVGPYNVTKAAVVALSETLAGELRPHGVQVTVLCPSFFQTNLMDTSRGASEDKRELVAKLMERSKVDAEAVARAGLAAVEAGRLHAVPMLDGRLLWRVKRAFPAAFTRLVSVGAGGSLLERWARR